MKPCSIIGIDEVGRGPIAGPLCVGGCLMPIECSEQFMRTLSGIKDSKQLDAAGRAKWFHILSRAAQEGQCRFTSVLIAEQVIDTKGLSFALRRAIARTLVNLGAEPQRTAVLLDGGIQAPSQFLIQQTIIKGDEKEPLIASASIVAKVRRDRYMIRLAQRYPTYGFEAHKGYGTPRHYEALKEHGISPVHRMSFLSKFIEREGISIRPPLERPSAQGQIQSLYF